MSSSRALSRFVLIALAIPCVAFGGNALVFQAMFTSAATPATEGSLQVFAEGSHSFNAVAPNSGVVNGHYLLTDAGGNSAVDFGIIAHASTPVEGAAAVSFDMTVLEPTTQFAIEITDTTGIDITVMASGPVDSVDDDDQSIGYTWRDDISLHVEMHFWPSIGGRDVCVTYFQDLAGNTLYSWASEIEGGLRPIGGVVFTKLGGSVGALELDNIEIREL